MNTKTIIPDELAERIAETLKAVGHPVRLQIAALLEEEEMCVGDIVTTLGAKPAITSQQLNMLKDKRVLACRREGAKVFYRIANPNIIKLLHCIHENCPRKIENE
jgi:DNA-binding transcriptional ArsR family regulator